MLKLRKALVAGVLALTLPLSSAAYAAQFADTSGIEAEMSIVKVVNLGVFANPGENFNPEGAFTRSEFTNALNNVLDLGAAKPVAVKDLNTKNGANSRAVKMINHGFLKLNSKGEFQPSKGVTYAELAAGLAYGLGFKKHWSNRPIDYLFFLERKGVLSIDTDLDAVVTKEAAAVAFDKFITLKGVFQTDTGVVAEHTQDKIVINNGSEYVEYKLASDVSFFVNGELSEKEVVGAGSPVALFLNRNGEVAFVTGSGLDLLEGTIAMDAGKVKINGSVVKDVDLNAIVSPLPNDPEGTFTLTTFNGYVGAGVTFGGGAFFSLESDLVTMLNLYMAKIGERAFTVSGEGTVTVDFSDAALANQTFKVSEEAKIVLADAPDKALTVKDLQDLQASGKKLSAAFELNAAGEITSITAKAE